MAERHETQLARIRKARGITQVQLAGELGISKTTYSLWESGRIELGAERIIALSERLQCTPNDILGYNKPSQPEPEYFMALSDEERRFMELFRSLPPNIKHDIVDIMQTTAKGWRIQAPRGRG